ncbi:cAMP-regulated phosphoprotein 19-like [Lineus longissimus]|uniref:cAMP-regulated phosphoprotein 19-like n=1 Tax=Lineus longissimus TaxID=88925 RepID=UPI002B4E168A
MASLEERSSPIEKIAEDEDPETKDPQKVMKAEEEKFKQKYPGVNKNRAVPTMLQKRLHKGMKYFDSGDYNMAKDSAKKKGLGLMMPPACTPQETKLQADQEKAILQESTGGTIPTPENVPARKTSTCINTQVHPITLRAGLQS